jgi:hypothetical protein
MKNIHVLPTDKPSIVASLTCGSFEYSKTGKPFKETLDWKLKNIYITSDEEIKEGDWYYDCGDENFICKTFKHTTQQYQRIKIILTTDPDLIKDGVQAISDEFLEWFVKNPSCEEVKIESWQTKGEWDLDYKIIIPQEEPKQETFGEFIDKSINIISMANSMFGHKQETLEEAAENMWLDPTQNLTSKMSFIQGAKWQQKRMYSEDALIILLNKFGSSVYGNYTRNQTMEDFTIEWFEQYKKK